MPHPKSTPPPARPDVPHLLTETEAAARLNVSISTLRAHRFHRKGLSYVKLGRSVRYRPEDIAAYTAANIVNISNPEA